MRQVDAGKMEAKTVFNIEHDGDGRYDVFGGEWMPARIRRPTFREHYPDKENKPDWHYGVCDNPDFVEGQMNFNESDFKTKSGHLHTSQGADGRTLYSLGIHSNACYTLREKVTP